VGVTPPGHSGGRRCSGGIACHSQKREKSSAHGKLRFGDRILTIGNDTVLESEKIGEVIPKNSGKTVRIRFDREGKIQETEIVFQSVNDIEPFVMPEDIVKR